MRSKFTSLIVLALVLLVLFRGEGHTSASLQFGDPYYLVASCEAPSAVKWNADYVADCVDDQVQIQAAINHGDHVVLSAGRFYISAPILISPPSGKYLHLEGQGSRQTIIEAANGLNADMIRGSGVQHYGNTIQGLWLVGNRANQTAGNGINVNGLSGLTVRDVNITDAHDNGIYGETGALNSDGVVLDNVVIWGSGKWGIHAKSWAWFMTNVQSNRNSKIPGGMSGGILLEGIAEVQMSNVSIDGDNNWGLFCSGCARVVASNLWIGANIDYALGFAGAVREIDMTGFRSNYSGSGVWFMGFGNYRNIKILGGGISDVQGGSALRFNSDSLYQGVRFRDWDYDIGVNDPVFGGYVPTGVTIN